MAILGLMLMWFVILTLFIGWAWIVFVAIGEDDSAAVALCAFVPLYIFIFAIARINKTWIPLTIISMGLFGLLLTDALFGAT